MDFKSLLQSMDSISENTVHKAGPGGYGNRYGSETQTDQYGKPIGKVSLASLGPKDDKPKTRGRPVDPDKPKTGKDDPKNKKVGDIFGRTTGDVPKGKKGRTISKMADADKAEKKAEKKSLKDWIEASEANKLNEAGEQLSIKPMPGASQIIGPDNKPIGTADQSTAQAIKKAADAGTLNLDLDDEHQMNEKFDKPVKTDPSEKGKYKGKSKSELLKAYNHLKKTGPHEKGSKQYENMKELAFAIHAKGNWGKVQEQGLEEGSRNKLPEEVIDLIREYIAKYEPNANENEFIQAILRGDIHTSELEYALQDDNQGVAEAKDLPGNQDKLDVAKPKGKLTKADFEALRKKKKVSEARVMEESEYTYEKIGKILAQENPTLDSNSDEFVSAVYHEMIQLGMTPKSAHNKLSYDEDFLSDVATSYGHYLQHKTVDEGEFTQHYMDANKPSKIRQDAEIAKAPQKHTPWSVDPINAATDRVGSFLKNLGQPKKTFESTNMKDIQLENWEKELHSLLNEGITVSSSTGQQGSPDSVSVNATDADAQQLLQVLRSAGVGVFGGEQEHSDYGAPMSSQEPTGTGTEPEASPEVVGDGDDMLALIKKMSGIQGGSEESSEEPEGTASSDYEDEEGEEHADHGSDNHDHEEDSGEESEEGEEEEQTDEGNAFGLEVMQKKNDNIPDSQQRIKTGGQNLPVKEEGHEHDEGGTCNECGMYEARCVCDHGEEQVEENYSNEAGHEEMAKLKALLSMGNDMHKMKHSQAVGNPTQVTFETTLLKDATSLLQDFQKLSGIK